MHFLRVRSDWLFYSLGLGGLFLLNHALLIMVVYRYDSGNALDSAMNGEMNSALVRFIPSAVVGVLMLIMRSVGAIAMPGIGYLSSRFSSRWGQRRPFLAASILPLALCFLLVFVPPALSSFRLSLYLSVLLLLFYLAFGAYPSALLGLAECDRPQPSRTRKNICIHGSYQLDWYLDRRNRCTAHG